MIALFALLLAAGQEQNAPATAAVSGSVLDAKTRQPVRRASVQLLPAIMDRGRGGGGGARPVSALTNEEGRFRITGVTPGEYVVTAQRNGYLSSGFGAGRTAGRGTRVTLATGDSKDGITIELMPQAVLAGRVVDDLGEPVMGAMVSATRRRGASGRGRGPGENNAMSNDRGEFRLYGLTAGSYVLAASGGRGLAAPQETGEAAYVTTYYPSVAEFTQAMLLTVGPGDEMGSLEIRLRTSPVFRVRGRVALADAGQTPNRCMLYLQSQGGGSGMQRPVASYSPDGRFEFRSVPPGSYLLVGQTTEGENRRAGVVAVEVTRGPADDVALLLSPGATITATMTLEGGDRQLPATARVSLSAADWTPWGASGSRPSAEGVIRVDRVFPGRYKPEVFGAWAEAYLARVLWNEQELPPGQPLEVSGTPGTLRLIYRLDGGSLQGSARLGDKPAPAGSVLLLPADEPKRQSPWVRLQPLREDGSFSFTAIAPGDYYVMSAESIETGDWDDPEWLRRMLAKAQKVTISARAEASATVEQQR